MTVRIKKKKRYHMMQDGAISSVESADCRDVCVCVCVWMLFFYYFDGLSLQQKSWFEVKQNDRKLVNSENDDHKRNIGNFVVSHTHHKWCHAGNQVFFLSIFLHLLMFHILVLSRAVISQFDSYDKCKFYSNQIAHYQNVSIFLSLSLFISILI